MINRIAIIGDPHGCLDEFKELYSSLQHHSLDEIWTTGDNIDRGPDSGGLIHFCIENNIKSVMGNHEDSILVWRDRNALPKNVDKQRTIKSLHGIPGGWDYISNLPMLHVFDNLNLVIVHAGLDNRPLYAQDKSVLRKQLVHPGYPGQTRWFIKTPDGTPEEELIKQGWRRWYDVYNYFYNVCYGHSRVDSPKIIKNGDGTSYGIDTGSAFGGHLTALIYPDIKFIKVKCKEYCKGAVDYD